MKIEQIAVSSLKSYERNARTHSDAQVGNLVKSIQEFGFVNPVLIDENNILIAGHGRTAAAKKIGLKTVPAIRLSGLTEPQKKALRLADNKLALDAGWDEELLKMELTELQTEDFDLDLIGFSGNELEFYLQQQNIDDFFERAEEQQGEATTEKKKECIKCPHCGELVEL